MRINKKLKTTMITFAVILVFINLLIFLNPFSKGAVFWIAYVFLMIAFILQFVISYLSIPSVLISKTGVAHYPMLRMGIIYLIIQTIASFIFFIVDSYIEISFIWIPLVICLLILGIFAGVFALTYSSINIVEKVTEDTDKNTEYISNLLLEIDILCHKSNNPVVNDKLHKLYELVRYSDLVSSNELSGIEQKINEYVDILKSLVESNDVTKIDETLKKLSELMYERNKMCKLLK